MGKKPVQARFARWRLRLGHESALTGLGLLFALSLVHQQAAAETQDDADAEPLDGGATAESPDEIEALRAAVAQLRDLYPEMADQLFAAESEAALAGDTSAAELLQQIEALVASGYIDAEEAANLKAALQAMDAGDAADEPSADIGGDASGLVSESNYVVAQATPATTSGAGAPAAEAPAAQAAPDLSVVLPALAAGGLAIAAMSDDNGDTSPPNAPGLALAADSGKSATDLITNNGQVVVSGLESGASWQFSTDAGAHWTNGTGTGFTLAAGNYAAGAVLVRQTDAAGNVSSSSGFNAAVTVDTSSAAPGLALAVDTGSSATDRITSNGQVNVTGLESGGSWQYSTDGGTTWATGSGTSFVVAAGSYAANAIQVRQTDVAGNTSTAANLGALSVDTTAAAPGLSLAADNGTSASDGLTNNGQMSVTGLESGATWQYSTDGGANWTTGSGSSFSLPAGSYAANAVQVRQTDAAGNVSAVASQATAITVETVAPVLVAMTTTGNSNAVALTYDSVLDDAHSASAGQFVVTINGVAVAVSAVATTGSVVTLTLAQTVARGDTVSVKYTDPSAGDDSTGAVQDAAGNDASSVVSGKAADGYVRGAQVYADFNGNGRTDAGELLEGVVTDAAGNFFLPANITAPIIVKGGVNIDTGVPNTLVMKAPAGASMVSPLTTLVQTFLESNPGATAATANTAVLQALGLPSNVNLASFDPLAALEADPSSPAALAVQKAAAQIATIVALASAGGNAEAVGTSVLGSLVDLVEASAAGGSAVNLADTSTLTNLLSTSGSTADVSAIQAVTNAIATATTIDSVSDAQGSALDKVAPTAPMVSIVASDAGEASIKISFNTQALDGSAAVAGDTLTLLFNGESLSHVLTAEDIAAGHVIVDGVAWEQNNQISATLADSAGNASPVSNAESATALSLLHRADILSVTLASQTSFSFSAAEYTSHETVLGKISNLPDDYSISVTGVGSDQALQIASQDNVDLVSLLPGQAFDLSASEFDAAAEAFSKFSNAASDYTVTVHVPTDATAQDVVELDHGNGLIDILDLDGNALGLSDAQASALVQQGVQFATNDTAVSVQAAGTHLQTSLSDLQKLGVDSINVSGLSGTLGIAVGDGDVDLGDLPTITDHSGLVVALELEDPDAFVDVSADQVRAAAMALNAAGFDALAAADGSLTLDSSVVQAVHQGGLVFAAGSEITMKVESSAEAGVLSALGSPNQPNALHDIDVVDLVDNAIDISDAQAAALVQAGVQFATDDTGVTLHAQPQAAAGTMLQTSLSDLQKLGVDNISMAGLNGAVGIAVGDGDLDFTGLPEITDRGNVLVGLVIPDEAIDSSTTASELLADATALHEAGFDMLMAADGSLTLDSAQVKAIHDAGLTLDPTDEVTMAIRSGAETTVMSNLVGNIDAGHYPHDLDVLDVLDNAIDISDQQAASLVEAGLEFAANDMVAVHAAGTHLQTGLTGLQKLGVDAVHTDAGVDTLVVALGEGPLGEQPVPVFDSEDHVVLAVRDNQLDDLITAIGDGGSDSGNGSGSGNDANIDVLRVVLQDSLGSSGVGAGVLDPSLHGANGAFAGLELVVSNASLSEVTLGMVLDAADGSADPLKMLTGHDLVAALQAAGISDIHIDEGTRFTVADSELKALLDAGLISADDDAHVEVSNADAVSDASLAQLAAMGADRVTSAGTELQVHAGVGDYAGTTDLEAKLAELLESFKDSQGEIKSVFSQDPAHTVDLIVGGNAGASAVPLSTDLFEQLQLLGIDDVLDEHGHSLKPPSAP